ncbi:MAG: hypothetical protein R2720_10310 [Candidatus Nanopelagicales bacterium]
MSDNDDIERLLREIDASTSPPSAQPPARRPESSPAKAEKTSKGGGTGLAIAAVIGVVGLVLGTVLGFLPYINGISLGLGGFLGAYIAWSLGRRFG